MALIKTSAQGLTTDATNLVLLNTQTTTDGNTTNINFDSTYITSNYTNYVAYANVKPATDGVQLRIRFFVNGILKSGASDYGVGVRDEGGGGTNDNDIDYLFGSQTNVGNQNNNESVCTQFNFFNLTSSNFSSGLGFLSNSVNANGLHAMLVGGGAANYSDANDGIRFYWSAGNFASGSKISLYGVKS